MEKAPENWNLQDDIKRAYLCGEMVEEWMLGRQQQINDEQYKMEQSFNQEYSY